MLAKHTCIVADYALQADFNKSGHNKVQTEPDVSRKKSKHVQFKSTGLTCVILYIAAFHYHPRQYAV